ncbi:arsenate reductase/protein-tyrosine-phosphatase family protein [Rhodobacter capsulatus]|uniref:arsenate reductase/protein-tyrosine-phosphatase family protein n=1 Tax=Rhodobacter capsulatus TaxID=1061 RepID=UPI004026F53F
MEHKSATQAFAALGHPDRLAVFRLLMRFAPLGVRPTEIGTALGLRPSTLSHHLSDLVAAGLVTVERRGRSLLHAVDLSRTEALIGYLALDVGRARPDLLTGLPQPGPERHGGRNVLFLCTGNSARSLMAEALLRDLGKGRFIVHSAGAAPAAAAHPAVIALLARAGHDTCGLHPKSLNAFRGPTAPVMDFVFTLCDNAAAEECPPWPGQPLAGHWSLPDPLKAEGTEAERALILAQTYSALSKRIAAFVALPFESLDRLALQTRLDGLSLRPAPEA